MLNLLFGWGGFCSSEARGFADEQTSTAPTTCLILRFGWNCRWALMSNCHWSMSAEPGIEDWMVGREILAFSYCYIGVLQCCFCVLALGVCKKCRNNASQSSECLICFFVWWQHLGPSDLFVVQCRPYLFSGFHKWNNQRLHWGWLMYFMLTPGIGRMVKEYEPVSDYGHQDAAFRSSLKILKLETPKDKTCMACRHEWPFGRTA